MGSVIGDSLHPQFPQQIPQGHATTIVYTHTHSQKHHLITDLLAEEKAPVRGEGRRYRISNEPGMKRFLIFRLAVFQWAGVLNGAQTLIPAPGSIIGVSCRSPWSPQKCADHWNPGATHIR